ncbi:hypothetical protein F5Y08DRAFT_354417 [Xylaria arbuscula]|uniref:Chitosanase n=1 Tax=Xylaria arbuscula TaxID=114810 RepID=A0A9W8NM12_9PEZI|nr:hypothetical protein F5Y08DRAFT_354417 [Xylaria arbuscula]KAJ3579661.1 hypothetical protein NPX13_g903 [Xylaria arbuscula]
MHSSIVLALATLATGAMSKIFSVGPSFIHITGKNDTRIKGYGQSCHAGAAAAGLCYVDREDDENLKLYYFNYSTDATGDRAGALTFNMEFQKSNGTETMPFAAKLRANPGSNMQVVIFGPGLEEDSVFSAGDDGKFFISGLRDDSHWGEKQPAFGGHMDLQRFYLCWQWVGFYWRRSIAWASSLPPQNPSCEPVNVRIGI